ncbi:islet cell autoantigen 1-like isoform X2 [Eriocheir sinensis]|nr:islet cell autoantigen 1-like isoform X2 [Eriocheir sinensis]XP_050739548.1 islet cell autoantigen 1-like isoform X2 [Eriocheir sinensis]XP_050739549.1 islet cell autoantigen 1-like isoform X2 [Eriocheir sinensis]XP_050739550.1 islet cell autoantigen 1-like isoform X2 [Eriocheir sinensis]
MTQQLHSYSGQNYDRWVQRNSSTTTLGKVQKQFWFTKSAVIRKLGKKEDEHVVASDAELDAKIELFKAIETSTKNLQVLLADYQNKICLMAQEENALGRLLKEQGKQDRTRAGKVMAATGKSLSYTAQQRVALRNPLVRLFQEVDTFYSRAVEDTAATVTEMEKVRTEYRGALMWMKNVSQDFNPDQHSQLEKFREVQGTVKLKKAKFDRMKLKSLQKVDLLAASRCNMFSHALIVYQNGLVAFSEKAARTMNNVANSFKGHQPYQFMVIRELADMPLDEEEAAQGEGEAEEGEAEAEGDGEKVDGDEKTFFNAEYHDQPRKGKEKGEQGGRKAKGKARKADTKSKTSDSLMNLLECEGGIDGGGEGGGVENGGRSPLVDLLGPEPELPRNESETQQLLRELFESPVRQPLPVFGSLEVAASSAAAAAAASGSVADPSDPFSLPPQPSQPGQPPQNMFLPSQLLDFGMQGWPQTPTTPTSQAPTGPSTTLAATTTTGRPTTTNTTTSNTTSLKDEVQKLDWYKVFQDIDPLGDPASALFNTSGDEGKQC